MLRLEAEQTIGVGQSSDAPLIMLQFLYPFSCLAFLMWCLSINCDLRDVNHIPTPHVAFGHAGFFFLAIEAINKIKYFEIVFCKGI